jgi:hypothetical protein
MEASGGGTGKTVTIDGDPPIMFHDHINIRVVPVPAAGNHIWMDDPERVVDEIERFLATPSIP